MAYKKKWPKCFLAGFALVWFCLLNGILAQTPAFNQTPPSIQYVLQGNTATFEWDFNTDLSQLQYGTWTWKKTDSGKICIDRSGSKAAGVYCGSNYILQGKATMLLRNVTTSMAGVYECDLTIWTASGPIAIRSSATLRVVTSSPIFTTKLPSSTNGIEGGKDVVLTAQVTGDYTPVINWYRNEDLANNVTFPISSLTTGKTIQSNLTIKTPNRNSNAVFLAKAVYGTHSPQSNMSVALDVWYAPENIRLTSSKSGMGISQGDSVTISCTATSNPVSRYTIYRNQTVVLNNALSGVLTINSFSEVDSGNYSCMAKNEVNSSTADGVWFTYVKPIPTTTPAITSTTNKSATVTFTVISKTSTVTKPAPGGGGGTLTGSNDLPWWVWLIVAIAVLLLISLAVVVFCCFRKAKKPRTPVAREFSKKSFDIDSYIKNSSFEYGYEHQNGASSEPKQTRELPVDEPPHDPETAKINLGMKFESEADLLEHIRKAPEDDYGNDVDFKDYDPFESDDDNRDDVTFRSDSIDPFTTEMKDPYAFDNGTYQPEETYKVNSESEKGSEREPELFVNLHDDIILYNI